MNKVLKGLVALIALFCTMMWARWMFGLDAIAAEWSVLPQGSIGNNNLRADIGSVFLSTAVFCLLYLLRRQSTWLYAAATVMACALLGRMFSVAVDGFARPVLVPMVVEIVFIGVFLLTARNDAKSAT